MRFFRQFSILFFLFIFSGKSYAQEISGTWKGKIYPVYGVGYSDTILITLTLTVSSNKFIEGTSTCHFNKTHYVQTLLAGKIYKDKKSFYVEEKKIIKVSNNENTVYLTDKYELKFDESDPDKLSGDCICIGTTNPSTPCHERSIIVLNRVKLNSEQ